MLREMRQQWLHGFLDLSLLSLLAERRDYGVGLTERLSAVGLGEVPGGTLYPSLLRLETQGLVRAVREPSASGPPRKYYELTAPGRAAQVERSQAWGHFRAAVDAVIVSAHGAVMEGTS